jgi:uncharacterized coiled-coil protein SlyX
VLCELEEYQMPVGQQKSTFESVAAALAVTHRVINLMETQMQPLHVKLSQLVKMNSEFGVVDEIMQLMVVVVEVVIVVVVVYFFFFLMNIIVICIIPLLCIIIPSVVMWCR